MTITFMLGKASLTVQWYTFIYVHGWKEIMLTKFLCWKKKMHAGAKMRIWTVADLQTESPMSINQINQLFQICWPLNNDYIIIHCCLTACSPCLFEWGTCKYCFNFYQYLVVVSDISRLETDHFVINSLCGSIKPYPHLIIFSPLLLIPTCNKIISYSNDFCFPISFQGSF